MPPKPGLSKLPSEPLPSLKLEKVRVKTKSEVYEPLTERETTGGMARGLARDRAPAGLRCWLDFSDATDVESRGVALPAEKLYFPASAFDADDVADARRDLL